MNSNDKSVVILFSLLIIGVTICIVTGILTSRETTRQYIENGYQECWIPISGTKWQKECQKI
jgi:hypothetical protein